MTLLRIIKNRVTKQYSVFCPDCGDLTQTSPQLQTALSIARVHISNCHTPSTHSVKL